MAPNPPKGSASSRPPSALSDGGRLITAGAAGASVLLLSVTAVVLWPRTYGAEATLVLNGNAQVGEPMKLASRIEAALLEREVLAAAAMDLPPELRSPDPIGRLRAGIRVQSRGALGYVVEFRGSDPVSVQRITNRLADRAVTLVPALATSPEDAAPLIDLSTKTRAVTDFLTAHPEMAPEQAGGDKPGRPSQDDSGLALLRTEKRQIEQRLATGASDNPYADPNDNPALLTRRLEEIKLTIGRREAALKQPTAAAAPSVSPELTAEWRTLLAQLADAQARASRPTSKPPVTAHVSARATLPTSPLTPNRLVLSIVAVLLSLATAMLAFVLPRKAVPTRRQQPRSNPPGPGHTSSDAPPALAQGSAPPPAPSNELPPRLQQSEPPPAQRSDAPPPRASSEPPGPVAPMRTVVLSSSAPAPTPRAEATPRRHTSPGGMEAPTDTQVRAFAAAAAGTGTSTAAPPPAPLFGSRPPPGAGSYSVSSSHPPPFEGAGTTSRTSVERLSPLQAQRAADNGSQPLAAPVEQVHTPQIMSRPPALDPEAERWAARFETPPPADPQAEAPAGKRSAAGRWKTQVMGSMVPLEVQAAREERRPLSEPPPAVDPSPAPGHDTGPGASNLVYQEVSLGWRPNVDASHPALLALRDTILKQGMSRHLRLAVTGAIGSDKAPVAAGLALALAQAGVRVLLVEADFDHPQLHQVMAVAAPPGAGFSQQITSRRLNAQGRPWVVTRCLQTLAVLAEGRLRSPGVLASEDFGRALRELGEQHHVLVMNAPSLDRPTDLRIVDALVQAAVLAPAGQAPSIQLGNHPLTVLLGKL